MATMTAMMMADGVNKNGMIYDTGSGPGGGGNGLTSIVGDDIVALVRSLLSFESSLH